MNTRRQTKLLREGQLVAEVDVELIESDEEWAPYLPLEEAKKLDSVRKALRAGDVEAASRLARVTELGIGVSSESTQSAREEPD
ncbi:MAG TPA: hypothetical protein VF789_01045 [Thermoanaerobaculia bacterium]